MNNFDVKGDCFVSKVYHICWKIPSSNTNAQGFLDLETRAMVPNRWQNMVSLNFGTVLLQDKGPLHTCNTVKINPIENSK